MADWFVRRGTKIAGPFSEQKLEQLANDGHLVSTDELASSNAGPWKTAGQSRLFPVPAPPPAPTKLALPAPLTVVKTTGRGFAVVWKSAANSLAAWNQRRHEIKLAKIRLRESIAKAELEMRSKSSQPPVQQTSVPGQPTVIHQTVVQVANNNSARSSTDGCASGCLLIIIVAILAFLILAAITPTSP